MATPMSSAQLRYGDVEPDRARSPDPFAVWGWTGWVWGIVPWLIVVYYAYPPAWALYHGKLTPLAPGLWVLRGLYFVFVFILVPAWALYAGWVFFFVLRIAGDRITVGRWFGLRRRVYSASDIGAWHLVDRRVREVADARAASVLRIDFVDGSWVGMPRRAWNFRKLDAWLRERASWGGAVPAAADALPSRYRFVVRDPVMVLMALAGWVLCWMFGLLSIAKTLSGEIRPQPGLGGVVLYMLGFVMTVLLPFILGPLCAHLLLKKVRVDAPHIHVDRWFGLIRRTYREDDIKRWRVSLDPNPPWWRLARDASLLVHFADSTSVLVRKHATNFRLLHGYLRDRASSRQDAARTSS